MLLFNMPTPRKLRVPSWLENSRDLILAIWLMFNIKMKRPIHFLLFRVWVVAIKASNTGTSVSIDLRAHY